MAVNTETKRRSVAGMLIAALAIAPVPDGTVAAVDREHIIGIYAGIPPVSPAVDTDHIHIFSTGKVEPNHVSDSGDNLLLAGDLEVQGDVWVDGTISDGTATLTGGNYSSAGTITSGNIKILSPTPILVFQDSNSLGAASVGFIEWRDSGGGRAGFFGNNTAGDDGLLWKNEQGGDIGIQTTGAGVTHIGDGTNESQIEADGTLKFLGNATVFRDINIGAATLSGPPGLQPGIANFVDNLGADTGIATSGLAVGEGFSGELEMQHDYKEGSNITFHVHFEGITAPTGTDKIQFQLTYTVGHSDTTLAPVTIITIEVDFDTQYEFKLVSFAAISGTGIHIEDQFLFTLQRIAASADEYGGEALIATVGIHYETDTVGSRQILVK